MFMCILSLLFPENSPKKAIYKQRTSLKLIQTLNELETHIETHDFVFVIFQPPSLKKINALTKVFTTIMDQKFFDNAKVSRNIVNLV
jgi:hypothetical protein